MFLPRAREPKADSSRLERDDNVSSQGSHTLTWIKVWRGAGTNLPESNSDVRTDIVLPDNCAIEPAGIGSGSRMCLIHPLLTQRVLMRIDDPGCPQGRGRCTRAPAFLSIDPLTQINGALPGRR